MLGFSIIFKWCVNQGQQEECVGHLYLCITGGQGMGYQCFVQIQLLNKQTKIDL